MPRQTIPDFIRADNRRDDEFENVPGLRRQERFEGRELVSSMWVVDNSTAAQGASDENGGIPITDPCAGREGTLTYTDERRDHIWERHGDPANATGSTYIVGTKFLAGLSLYNAAAELFGWEKKTYRDVFQWRIEARNQETFNNAVGIPSGGNTVYISAVYFKQKPDIEGEVVGIDIFGPNKPIPEYTNVNTVVVGPDCQSVTTSHPGMPTRPAHLPTSDPRIRGNFPYVVPKPTWWPLSKFKTII